MGPDDVITLSRLNKGWDQVDQGAALLGGTGVTRPSQIAKPLETLLPDALQPLQGKWQDAANVLGTHINDVNSQVGVIRANWETPDTFQPYMSEMATVLGKQQKAMQDMDGVITQLAATFKQYKQDGDDANELLHEMWWNALAWAAAAILMVIAAAILAAGFGLVTSFSWAAFMIELILAGLVGALAGGLGSWMPKQYTYQKRLRTETDGLKGELGTLQAEADSRHVRDITPPSAPAIDWQGYKSIHDPHV